MTGVAGLQFFVILGDFGNPLVIERIQTNKQLQRELTDLFEQQAADFLNPNNQIVAFDSGYTPHDGEIQEIAGYPLPQAITDAAAQPHQVDPFTFADHLKIKAIFAADHHGNKSTRVYFQAMNKTKVINRGSIAILLNGTTFQKLEEPGLSLDSKLAVAYQSGNLYLRSFATANRFLDLNDYFREATNEEIGNVLNDEAFLVADADAVISNSDSWMRKRFSALLASGILKGIRPRTVANRAKKYGIEIDVRGVNGKQAIAFPTEKKAAKKLLSFLNEEFYQGELSDRLYQTNSKRALAVTGAGT